MRSSEPKDVALGVIVEVARQIQADAMRRRSAVELADAIALQLNAELNLSCRTSRPFNPCWQMYGF